MTASLEEEIVYRMIQNGNTPEEIVKSCTECIIDDRIRLPLNPKLIQNAIERQNLLYAYNSQKNRKREIRKRKMAEFERAFEEKIEEFKKQDLSIISGNAYLRYGFRRTKCDSCGEYKKSNYCIELQAIKKLSDGTYSKHIISPNLNFFYCWNCLTVGLEKWE